MVVSFIADDIECEGCANSIKKALGKMAGINSVSVDVFTKTTLVTYDKETVDVEAIRSKLCEIGFPAKAVE
jgi:Cu+-exporting ATPase